MTPQSTLTDRPGGVALGASQTYKRATLRRCKKERPAVTVTAEYLRGLALNERDRNIVRYLGEIGYATTDQIGRMFFVGPNASTVARRRLKRLWEWHILDRVPGSGLERYGISTQLVYLPGAAGLVMLAESDPDGAKLRKRRGTNLLYHNVLLGEALAGLAQTARARGYDLTFYGERGTYASFALDDRKVEIRPDGLLIVQAEKERPFYVEMDTGMRETDAFAAKVKQYEWFCANGEWKTRSSRFPGVLIVVWASVPDEPDREAMNRKRSEKAQRRLEQVIDKIKALRTDRAITWLFACLDQVGTGEWVALDQHNQVRRVCLFDRG